MNVPGIVIAGTNSGVGKTTISIAIIYGLLAKGYIVQPYKIGPDYIDPSYHNIVSKRKSRNLDVWLMGKPGLIRSYNRNNLEADFTVLEGVMGLYDGLNGKSNFASTAHISEILNLPIILIVDAKKAARSVAAIILGFLKFDSKVKIVGIIVNNIASEKHLKYVKEAIENKIKLPLLGCIFRATESSYSERHLGLIPTIELDKNSNQTIINKAREISKEIDIDKIAHLAKQCLRTTKRNAGGKTQVKDLWNSSVNTSENRVKILVALDKSFNFYYQDNLDSLLKHSEIEFFSPIDDIEIPQNCSGMIIGGGFPEVIADNLEKNSQIRKKIHDLAEDGAPIHAECGGLMYLTKSISGFKNSRRKFRMIGFFDAETTMTRKLTLGYTEALISQSHPFLTGYNKIKGHEFHYSTVTINNNDSKMLYTLKRGKGISNNMDGLYEKNCIASYMHTYFVGKKAKNFVECCVKYSKS